MLGRQGAEVLKEWAAIPQGAVDIVERDIGAGRGVEDGQGGIQTHRVNILPGEGLPHAPAFFDGETLCPQPDQPAVEAVDEEHGGAESRHTAGEHGEPVKEAAALEGHAAEHQLADAEEGEDQALAGAGAGGQIESLGCRIQHAKGPLPSLFLADGDEFSCEASGADLAAEDCGGEV